MRASEIRELMKLASRPDIVSFSGGMPGPELFPVEEIDEIYSGLPLSVKRDALQYGPTPGYPPLIESLKTYLKSRGLSLDGNRILITTGSLQAIYLTAKVFLDPGDRVVTEDPTFIGAIAAFRSFQVKLDGVPLDDDGIEMNGFVQQLDSKPIPKLAYLMPNFNNPAGLTMSRKRRIEVIETLKRRDIVLLEDDPYHELYFDESDRELVTPIKALAEESFPICYAGSFSKMIGPGMRLGWLLAPDEISLQCEIAKQSVDACSPTFTQVLAHSFLSQGKLDPYLKRLRIAYARRAASILKSLDAHMPDGVIWTKPRGGFYVWVTLPKGLDASEVFTASVNRGAAFVVGKAFDPQGIRNNHLRLSFSNPPEDQIEDGIRIIAGVIKEQMKK
jgi:DNA-binding transcriptional MocR family regulator